MQTPIQFSGYTTVPSDYECADGQMAASLNLICEDGAMQPVMQPQQCLALADNQTAMYIHKTSVYTHFIIVETDDSKAEDEIYYVARNDAGEYETAIDIAPVPNVTNFNAVGNTLLVLTVQGIYYFLWKDGKYVSLGDHIPNIQLSFGLVGHPRFYSVSGDSEEKFTVEFTANDKDYYYNGDAPGTFDDDDQSTVTAQVMAKVNKFIAAETVNKGRYCFPFFVRYALRLYDGNLIYHSAPILMNPSTSAAPIVTYEKATFNKDGSCKFEGCNVMLVAADLDWRNLRNKDYSDIDNWADIIKSVDVFISKPIYTYDQSEEIESYGDDNNFNSRFIGKLYADTSGSVVYEPSEDKLVGLFNNYDFLDKYAEWDYSTIYAMYYTYERTYPSKTIHLPEFTASKVDESLTSNANFYKLCTLEFDDIAKNDNTRHLITTDDDYLQSLVSREAMTDDYLSRDQLHADYSFAYNSRLNLAGIKRKPYVGFYAQSMFAYLNARFNIAKTLISSKTEAGTTTSYYRLDITESGLPASDWAVYTYIKENGSTYVVASEFPSLLYLADWFSASASDGTLEKRSWGCWLYYPNTNAYKMVLHCSNKNYSVDLAAHDFLNGAYALLDYGRRREAQTVSLPASITETDKTYTIINHNKVYTSEVNNPFYFPVTGINTVGTGTIRGICSAAKALSQGQFGQFPLYAFCTDGIWALEVSSTGTYSAKQPITRDVCINSDGITQLDSSVLFPTDRGIMQISGSQTQCITDDIFSETPFNILDLPAMHKLHAMLGNTHANDTCMPVMPFTQFLQACRMVYDYLHQRVIVFNPTQCTTAESTKVQYTYAYVYSLKSKQWGMMYSTLLSALNAYPEALAMTQDKKIVSFYGTDQNTSKGLFVTRPLKLNAPDVLKTVTTVIQRGLFEKGNVNTVLYASRDLYKWQLVWSSKDHYLRGFRGTPYKYFRIAAVTTLAEGKSVSGADVEFEQRLGGQLR